MNETLGPRLAEIRARGEAKRPAHVTAMMHAATEDLRASGILEGVARVGQRAPLFARPDLEGRTVHLRRLIERGPVVLSFFRGRW